MSDETEKTESKGPDRIAQMVGVVAGVALGAYVAYRAVSENDNGLISAILIFLLIGVPTGLFAIKFVEAVKAFLSGDLFDDWERMSRMQGQVADRRKAEAEAKRAASRAAAAAAPAPSPAAAVAAGATAPEPAPEATGRQPAGLDEPRDGAPDDLTRMKGVGPKVAAWLNSKGYWHYDQIAAWSDEEVAWVDANLEGVKGRASRDDWVGQAKALAAGREP
jgi:predicted flap endonuclease-1-like 5' DNA nuclease